MSQTRNNRNGRDSLRSPLVSHFPSASDIAPSPANAPVDSLSQPASGIWYIELSPDRHPSVIGEQFSWFAGIGAPLPAPPKWPRLRFTTQRRRGARLEQLENASEGFH